MSSRGSPPRRPRSPGPAATSASAATARCRGSATTGRCGPWPAAAGSRWKSSAPPRSHGAEAIGYAQDLGSLETGKLADLVVLATDPLEDIHNTNSIRYVMKNGELFEGDTLDQTWPDRKPLPRLWWWEETPSK